MPLREHQTKEIHICFDRDEAGDQRAAKDAGQLKEKNKVPPYPSSFCSLSERVDINSFFLLTAEAPSIFERILKEANRKGPV